MPSLAVRPQSGWLLTRGAVPLLGACLVTACGSPPEARYATQVPAKVAAPEGVETYALGPSHVRVETDVSGGGSYTLAFSRIEGTLVLSAAVPESTTLDLSVDMASATTSWQLVADIAMSDFLEAPKHPRALFTTRSLRKLLGSKGEPDSPNLEVYADFTLHGTKRTLVVPATLAVDPCRARLRCEFTIQRSAFGAVDDGSYESFVSDDAVVRVLLDVARRGAPATCAKGGSAKLP